MALPMLAAKIVLMQQLRDVLESLNFRFVAIFGVGLGICTVILLRSFPLERAALPQQTPVQEAVLKTTAAVPAVFTFPAGSQKLLPDNRIVALYGTPGSKVLGSLGEQDLPAAIARAKATAEGYKAYSTEPVIP